MFDGCCGMEAALYLLFLPPQQQVRTVMDEAGEEKANWYWGLMDKVSHAS